MKGHILELPSGPVVVPYQEAEGGWYCLLVKANYPGSIAYIEQSELEEATRLVIESGNKTLVRFPARAFEG